MTLVTQKVDLSPVDEGTYHMIYVYHGIFHVLHVNHLCSLAEMIDDLPWVIPCGKSFNKVTVTL